MPKHPTNAHKLGREEISPSRNEKKEKTVWSVDAPVESLGITERGDRGRGDQGKRRPLNPFKRGPVRVLSFVAQRQGGGGAMWGGIRRGGKTQSSGGMDRSSARGTKRKQGRHILGETHQSSGNPTDVKRRKEVQR